MSKGYDQRQSIGVGRERSAWTSVMVVFQQGIVLEMTGLGRGGSGNEADLRKRRRCREGLEVKSKVVVATPTRDDDQAICSRRKRRRRESDGGEGVEGGGGLSCFFFFLIDCLLMYPLLLEFFFSLAVAGLFFWDCDEEERRELDWVFFCLGEREEGVEGKEERRV